jgi:CrcB protein
MTDSAGRDAEKNWASMQDILHGLIWVTLGSVLGGPARYFLSGFTARRVGETFPWGTIAVNVTGAFAIGVIATIVDGHALLQTPAAWQFAVVGFLGSYTTVSSFSLQTLALVRDGEWLRAGGNVFLSLILCLGAVALGYAIGTAATELGMP